MNGAIACLGGLRTDFIITLEREARLNQMGGNALYSAAGARLWADMIYVIGRTGSNFPRDWLAALDTRGIDTRGVIDTGAPQDHRTFYAYIDQNTRDDTNPAAHFARIGQPLPEALRDYTHSTPGQDNPNAFEPLAITPDDLTVWAERCGHWQHKNEPMPAALHIAPTSIRTQQQVPAAARALGIGIVSVDPGERTMQPALMAHIEDMLGNIDVFLPSDQEVRGLFAADALIDTGDAQACARWFAARGPRIVVLKQGAQGCLVHEKDGGFWRVPALSPRVVDVTGAGDTFCGGFMAEFARSGNAHRAAMMGTAAASIVIEDYGVMRVLNASHSEALQRLARLLKA
jgi:sugar/nucleoside kinase (ribokinase family)